jgi:hypothetical protein
MKNFLRVIDNSKIYKYSGVNDFYWSLDEYGDNEMGASKYSPQQVLALLRNGNGELLEHVEFKSKMTYPVVIHEKDSGNLIVYFNENCAKIYIAKTAEIGEYTNHISIPLARSYYTEIKGKQKEKLLKLFTK